jgi:hypothetical protein
MNMFMTNLNLNKFRTFHEHVHDQLNVNKFNLNLNKFRTFA